MVSLTFRELKDNLGNDEPEGDMPVLLQALLSRNPKVFRDKSTSVHFSPPPLALYLNESDILALKTRRRRLLEPP